MQGHAHKAGSRLHALSVVSAALVAELKVQAGNLGSFSETPKSNPMSPALLSLHKVATFCGFWGVGNYLGALRELAVRIESVEPLSIPREEFIDRVKTLGAGINALGVYLLDLAAGNVVSYTRLNEQFARVLRKARPSILEMEPADVAALLFMPAPPTIEVDASWDPSPGASREALVKVLWSAGAGDLSSATLSELLRCNPYRTLNGLFEGAHALQEWVSSADMAEEFVGEFARLRDVLAEAGPIYTPPAPDAFLFSRLLHQLAATSVRAPEVEHLRKRYSLMKPGAAGVSMHDMAKKFFEGMRKLEDGYRQAALTKTPSMVKKFASQVVGDAHRLESPAFSTFAGVLNTTVQSWPQDPELEDWVFGAAVVLLLKASAQTWGNRAAQESLASTADVMSGTGTIHISEVVQTEVQSAAVKKACGLLQEGFTEILKGIEGSLKSVGTKDMPLENAKAVVSMAGAPLIHHLRVIQGVATCLMLPMAADLAGRLADTAGEPSTWASNQSRATLFQELSRLSLFIARLRPGSLLDLELDQEVHMDAGDLPVEAEEGPAPGVEALVRADDSPQELPEAVSGDVSGVPDVLATGAIVEVEDHVVQGSDDAPVDLEEPSTANEDPVVAQPEAVGTLPSAPDTEVGDSVSGGTPDIRAESSTDVPVPASEEWSDFVPAREALDVLSDEASNASAADAADDFDFLGGLAAPAKLPSIQELEAEFLRAQDGQEDTLDQSDAELLNIMFEESWACLEGIDLALAQAKQGSAVGTKSEASRHIHTLKGVCRTCGLEATGAILHAMEDRLDLMSDDGEVFSTVADAFRAAMVVVRERLERARAVFQGVGTAPIAATEAAAGVHGHPSNSAPEVDAPKADVHYATDAPLVTPEAHEVRAPAAAQAPVPTAAQLRPSSGGTVRIPVALADKVGNASSQVLTANRRARDEVAAMARSMRELQDNLRRIAEPLRELQMMAFASIASSAGQAGTQGFDPLELDRYTQMQEVTTRLVEAYEDTLGSAQQLGEGLRAAHVAEEDRSELTDELQRGSSELLLVPLASQLSRFEKVVTKACDDTGKQARMVIETGCRVPAAALDKLLPVLDHIVRNALAHGIERPAERVQAGKAAEGSVTIGAPADDVAEGGVIRISVRDDGGGIDLEKVLAIAVKRGLVRHGTHLSDDATRELLFMPGFSTAGSVSELAGRGVGLDVVRSVLSSLGGMVSVQSAKGRGTEFILTLPTDAASMAVVPVSAAGFRCLLPLTLVRRIVPVSAGADVQVDQAAGIARVAGQEFELIDLAQRVPASQQSARSGRGHLVLMRQSNVVKAVLVDSLGQQTRVVVKPLGPFVRDVPGMVAGATTPAGGASLVVNPLQLAVIEARAGEGGPTKSPAVKKVMVVDDSSTVRLVTSRFLKRCGYAVDVARDGLEALQLLSKGSEPDIFLFDLEMPGMGGFELISEVRRKDRFKSTPIVVVTSRTADKHRQRAMELGATHYLTKPYEDAQLQEVLTNLTHVSA